jgi:two-component system KDP operon response regulator KdpE
LRVDFGYRKVTVGGTEVHLTSTEYKRLYQLATNPGRVLTHDELLRRVWGPEYSGEPDLVRAMVRSLRRKLGDDAHNPVYISNEPRVGYRMLQS